MISFAIGFFLLLLVNLLRGATAAQVLSMKDVPPWLWLGGLCGVWIVCAAVFSVPVIGVLTALAALILGQMLAGMVIDAVGAFGLPQRPQAWPRIGAVLCVTAGLFLTRI